MAIMKIKNAAGEWEDLVSDSLEDNSPSKALSAKQGKVLDESKADKSDTYTKTEVNSLSNGKIDKPNSVPAGKFLQTDENGQAVWGTGASGAEVSRVVTEWLEENISGGQTIAIDTSLSTVGAAAESAAVGEALDEIIQVDDTEPVSARNKIWVEETPDSEIEIPDYEDFENLVTVSSDEPTASSNKVWIKPSGLGEVALTTYEEFTGVVAPDYDTINVAGSMPIRVGQHCIHSGEYYSCIVEITEPETFTLSHWAKMTVGSEASDLKSALTFDEEIERTGTYAITEFIQGTRANDNPTSITVKTTRITTAQLFRVFPGDKIEVSNVKNGYHCVVVSSAGLNSGWITANYNYVFTAETLVFINAEVVGGIDPIVPSDFTADIVLTSKNQIRTANIETENNGLCVLSGNSYKLNYTLGNINANTGVDINNQDTRVRTGFLKILSDKLHIRPSNNWETYMFEYTKNDGTGYIADGGDSSYHSEERDFTINPNHYYRIVCRIQGNPNPSLVNKIPDIVYSNKNIGTYVAEHIKDISDDIEELDREISEISQDIASGNVPSYLLTEVETAINSVIEKGVGDSIVMPVFTDAHVESLDNLRIASMLKCIKYMSKRIYFDMIVSLGDELAVGLGRTQHKTNAQIFKILSEFHSNIDERQKAPFIPINGNHDAIGADFFDAAWWNTATRNNGKRGNVVRETGEAYFYIDYPEKKLRLIFMSIPCGSVIDVDHPYPLWKAGNEQLSWLANKALNTGDGYSVALFCHTPTCYNHGEPTDTYTINVWDGMQVKQSNEEQLYGRCEDQTSIEGVFTAYKNHTTFSDSNVSCDFSGYTQTDVIIELCGHTHIDCTIGAGQSGTGISNGMPCKVVSIGTAGYAYGSSFPKFSGGVYPSRTDGTSTEVLFDIVVINLTNKKVSLIRVGAGNDVEFTYGS